MVRCRPARRRFAVFAFAFALPFQVSAQTTEQPDIMVVFDASGSMWGQVNGTAKIEIARDAFADLSSSWASAGQAVGLIAYGHRRTGDCADIEVLSAPSPEAAAGMATAVNGLVPRGKTPLSQAVRMAAQELSYTENPATVVLLSDGIETCDLDPCAVGAELESLGVDFTAHVIGFDIAAEADRAQLQCLAENTGGAYLDARDATSLADALSTVTVGADTPTGTISTQLGIDVAEGTARPVRVTLSAENPETGETQEVAVLSGADQVISGAEITLPAGRWVFRADGDGGSGMIEAELAADTQRIGIPFAATAGDFAYQGARNFATDGSISFQLRALTQLQQDATYKVMLFPAGATTYDTNITFSYRFGSDADPSAHEFFAWEYGLVAGDYEIVIIGDTYDLSETFGRFPIKLVEPGQAPVDVTIRAQLPGGDVVAGRTSWSLVRDGDGDAMAPVTMTSEGQFEGMPPGTYEVEAIVETPDGPARGRDRISVDSDATAFVIALVAPTPRATLDYVAEPLSPGQADALRVSGGALQGAQVMFIGLDGQETQAAPVAGDGIVGIPDETAPGSYRVHLIRPDGSDTFLDTLDILPDSAQQLGEDPETMASPEEISGETGPRTLPFEIWAQCDGPETCRITDPRVGLEWALPPDWAAAEPFYYTTAGGGQAEAPTVEMGRLSGGAFGVILNPRQWDAQLGPCEEVPQGLLCRDETEVAPDLADYQAIKASFLGDLPVPEGQFDLGRSWTIQDSILGGGVGLMRFDDPEEGAEQVAGNLMLSNPGYFGLTSQEVLAINWQLVWDDAPQVISITGTVEVEGQSVSIRLSRPGGWDGTTDTWRGEITNQSNYRVARVDVF